MRSNGYSVYGIPADLLMARQMHFVYAYQLGRWLPRSQQRHDRLRPWGSVDRNLILYMKKFTRHSPLHSRRLFERDSNI